MQPEPGWGLPSVRAWSAACVGPPAFPVGAFRAKGRRCQRMRHRRHCPVQRGLQTSRSPRPPAASQQLRVGSWPPIPPGDAVQHPWVLQCWRGQAHKGTGHLSSHSWCPHTPQAGSLLTLAGSSSCTGVSSVTWGTGGCGTTRSIQPIIPLAAGSAEGSPAGKSPAAGVHTAQGIPAVHTVS